ncbi:MAG: AraC family transcriptional regulator [Bacteroidales bacterium]|nr:AraC family transcriptional regulator [Bacteroidales bacterium]
MLPATLRSLFRHKEQAPSSPMGELVPDPMQADANAQVGLCLQNWVYGKGYRLPDRTPHESAERMGVDFQALHRYCITQLGMDFRSLRTRLRIRDAQQEMLAEPHTPIIVIARRVGYQDRSNFNKHFRQMTGVLPEVWRKKSLSF